MSDSSSIEEYIRGLGRALRVRSELRERILCEVEEHLREGAGREQQFGATPTEAARIVIERFGPPDAVALWWSEIYTGSEGGSGMWQRFTERARRVVFFSQEEAARLGRSEVDTEHLLLGLVREDDNVAVRLLTQRLGISQQTIREETERQATRGEGYSGGNMELTAEAKRAIDCAYEEQRRLRNDYIGTEHLLLGLIRQHEGLAARVLIALGADLIRVRNEILEMGEWDVYLMTHVKAEFQQLVERSTSLTPEARALVEVLGTQDPSRLADQVLSYLKLEGSEKRELQAIHSFEERLERLGLLLGKESTGLEIPSSPSAT
jgi:hypothetical protein